MTPEPLLPFDSVPKVAVDYVEKRVAADGLETARQTLRETTTLSLKDYEYVDSILFHRHGTALPCKECGNDRLYQDSTRCLVCPFCRDA